MEREPLLDQLRAWHHGALRGAGRLVFVSGEAGIGKTALLRAFRDGLDTPVHAGFCDALDTPRALGPLHDIARTSLARLGPLLAGDDRHATFTALLGMLAEPPSVTVIEDAHWVDQATADLLLFVGRRIGELPAMVVVTYRADEIGRDHPLRRVLGDLATARSVCRLTVPSLSEAAVTALAEPFDRDGARLFALTCGNPFFVTEALNAPDGQIPATVRDAVLARASRLSPSARAVLDVVSLVPDRAERDLVDTVAAADAVALDDVVDSGMLVPDGAAVRFRHELARRAVESAVAPGRAARLHARILRHLAAAGADPARLAFHADAAGDAEAVLRHAPPAGDRATAVGAHREATAHYARAVRHAGGAPSGQQAELHQRHADACLRSGDLDTALDATALAIDAWHAAGDVERAAVVLARRSNLLWRTGRNAEAHESAERAVEMVTTPGPAMAEVRGAHARLLMLARDMPRAIALGTTAMDQARRHGDLRTLARALNVVGTAHWFTDPDRAVELLSASLDAAHRCGDAAEVAGAMINLGSGAGEVRRYPLADRWLAETIDWSTARDLDIWRGYALAWRARSEFEQGRWAQASASATEALVRHGREVPTRIVALTVLGRLRTRRGDPDAQGPLTEAWELAQRTGDLQRLWPVAAGRAENAWLSGSPERIEDLVAGTLRLARDRAHEWSIGELGYWRWVAGAEPEPGAAAPFALQMAGEPGAAAACWRQFGCPYEAAVALARGHGGRPARRVARFAGARRDARRGPRRPAAARAGRARAAPRSAAHDSRAPGEPDRPRGRGARPARGRPAQRRHRRTAAHRHQDRGPPRLGDPRQAGRRLAAGSRPPGRPRWMTGARNMGSAHRSTPPPRTAQSSSDSDTRSRKDSNR